MMHIKKFHGDALLQLALLLSLLRIDYESYLEINRFRRSEFQEIILGSSSGYASINHNLDYRVGSYVHPKSVESMILNQQSIFYELNLLGRYNHYEVSREVTTYLLNEQQQENSVSVDRTPSSPSSSSSQSENGDQETDTGQASSSDGEVENVETVVQSPIPVEEENPSSVLTKEDMDLIDVLLKQDIDLGVTREVFDAQLRHEKSESAAKEEKETKPEETSPLNPWHGLNYTIDSETGEHVVVPENEETNDSGGLDSAITSPLIEDPLIEDDLLLSLPEEFRDLPLDDHLPLDDFNKTDDLEDLELRSNQSEDSGLPNTDDFSENFAYSEFEDMIQTQLYMQPHGRPLQVQGRVPYLRTISMEQRWQDIANILSLPLPPEQDVHNSLTMVHGNPHNFTHPANSPYNSIDNCSTILLRNATLPPPLSEVSSNVSFHSDIDTPNLATAVASGLSTLTNGSEPMGDTCHGTYSSDGSALIYPSHNHSEINQTTEGFLSSILNDDDLQLMDMAMNDSVSYNGTNDRYNQTQPMTGMYPTRMLENEDAVDTSSDSAVSSMDSSERVPSLPDGVHNCCHNEWIENGSESSHPEEHNRYYGMDYSHSSSMPSKYRNYEYSSYGLRPSMQNSNNSSDANTLERPLQPVAQKKYQLFGKRFPTEQSLGGNLYTGPGRNSGIPIHTDTAKYPEYPYDRAQHERTGRPAFEMVEGATAIDPTESKFSCSMEFARQHSNDRTLMEHIQHNHTYQLPPETLTNPQKPSARDKQRKKAIDDQHTRDEKRARALKIPLTTDEIINLPMDEFNERLSKFDLTESQLALIRDIRRRGKNKVAAQNCRKRKLDQIVTLADEVQNLQQSKSEVVIQHQSLMSQRQRLKDKFTQLYRHVFQSLRDPEGNPYSGCEYSLQQSANGNVMLIPRNNTNLDLDPTSGAKVKKKDDPRK